jgi:hypothetical protein
MLTDYLVHCPYEGCGWRGPLFAKGSHEPLRSALGAARVVVFECPRCHREWHARIAGDDDAIPLPLEEAVSPGA